MHTKQQSFESSVLFPHSRDDMLHIWHQSQHRAARLFYLGWTVLDV